MNEPLKTDAPAPSSPGVTVATAADAPRPTKRDLLDGLPPDMKERIQLRRIENAVAAELAGMSWGRELSHELRKAVAQWCRDHDVDPQTELDILGGKFYKNGAWALRKLGELVAAGVIEYARPDHVAADPRLDAMILETADTPEIQLRFKREKWRRVEERIRHGIPEDAVGACVYRIKHRHLSVEVTGVNWSGGGTGIKIGYQGALKRGADADPVGEAFPVKTAETRACRRAMKLLASSLPSLHGLEAGEQELGTIHRQFESELGEFGGSNPNPLGITAGGTTVRPVASPADPYATTSPAQRDRAELERMPKALEEEDDEIPFRQG